MSFYLKKSLGEDGQIAIWKMEEDISFFEARCKLDQEEKSEVDNLSGRKRSEWLASRYLLQLVHERADKIVCIKNEFGKPFLKNAKENISLSHSNEMATVIISPNIVGIDIQKVVPKIERIAEKFINDEEFENIGYIDRIEKMHILWGAKESLYKAYGKRGLDFRKNMFISDFEYNSWGTNFSGILKKDELKMNFKLWAGKFENYMLVYAIEI